MTNLFTQRQVRSHQPVVLSQAGGSPTSQPDVGRAGELHGSGLQLAVAGRGDHFEPYLRAELARTFHRPNYVNAELRPWQRLMVAGATFRPRRSSWQERYYKSSLGWRMRSGRANAGLRRLVEPADVVLQDHALFGNDHPRSVLYVDNTHQQSVDHWPDWNPLTDRQLDAWLRRERAQYHRQAHIFAMCTATAQSIIGDYGVPADRVSVVGAGPNLDELPTPRVDREPSDQPVILFVGNDFGRKGGEVLLRAFPNVRRRVHGARLVIAGEHKPSSPVPEGVTVLGRVRGADAMAHLYASADVFCMPSLYEPFGLSFLEAMAFGLPCVATVTGGVPEIIAHGVSGTLVQPGDEQGLASALITLLTVPGKAVSMGRAGRERVETTYQWNLVAERMRPVLERIGQPTPSYSPSDSAFISPNKGSSSLPSTP